MQAEGGGSGGTRGGRELVQGPRQAACPVAHATARLGPMSLRAYAVGLHAMDCSLSQRCLDTTSSTWPQEPVCASRMGSSGRASSSSLPVQFNSCLLHGSMPGNPFLTPSCMLPWKADLLPECHSSCPCLLKGLLCLFLGACGSMCASGALA